MPNKVTIYVSPDYYNGTTIIGHNIEGDVEVEFVNLELELPDLWDIYTVEEADAVTARLEKMLSDIQSVEYPYSDSNVETEFLIDDILFEMNEVKAVRAGIESGHYAYDDIDPVVGVPSDFAALAAESERELDDLPRNLREAFEERLLADGGEF